MVAVRGATAAGSELIRRAPDGTLTRVPAGTTETLSSLGVTPDGRVWAVVYGQARLLSAAPDGTRGELPLGSVPDALTVGADGALLLTRRGDSPAVLRVDPASGAVRTYPVGTPGVSVPAAPTPAPDGTLLFTETRAGGAWRLDPRSGAQVALPSRRARGRARWPPRRTAACGSAIRRPGRCCASRTARRRR